MSKVGLGTIKNDLAASDLPPEGPKKERSHFLIRGTLSKCEQKPTEGGQGMSKVGLGTIKNDFVASDLPPEGPKKERWAIS